MSQVQRKSSEYKLLSELFFRLLPYQILLLIIAAVNGIVDSQYASNAIGESALSAIGLFGPLNHFLYAASIMFVSGSQILYGRYLVRDRHKIGSLFTVNLISSGALALLTSLVLVVMVLTGATRVFVDTQPELQMFNDYILGNVIGIPALVLGQQLFAFLSLEDQRKRTMAAGIVCFVVNAALDQLFVVFLGMGPFGLGLASSISLCVFLAVQAMFYIRGKSEWKFSLKGCDEHDAPQIVKLGYAGALSRFLEMFRCLIVNYLIIAHVGSVGLASFAASNSLLAVFWPVIFGMLAVSRMLFSISVGEEDRRSLVDIMRLTLTKGMLIVLVMVAGLVLLAEPLTRLFFQDSTHPVYGYTVMGFRLLPLCMPLALVSLLFAAFAQVTERKVMAVILPVVDGMVGVVVCSLFLIPAMKMNGLYISNILNGVICAFVILIGAWVSLKRFPRNLEDLMAIPPRIGVTPDERIDISVSSIEDVMEVSRRVSAFCTEKGIDARRSAFAGLCMEEMAGNVVLHGFPKDNKENSIDIRVVHKDGEIVMRIRDNCCAFDPYNRYLSLMEPGECGRNIGIQLVYRIAKDVNYQNLLGMNVLTIRL